jgi:hypothetical protein
MLDEYLEFFPDASNVDHVKLKLRPLGNQLSTNVGRLVVAQVAICKLDTSEMYFYDPESIAADKDTTVPTVSLVRYFQSREMSFC